MKARICIAGSGKMAINIGLFFLQREQPVYWLSHSAGQLENIKKIVHKTRRRVERFCPEKLHSFSAATYLYTSEIPRPDIIIESSRESLNAKKVIFSSLSHLINDQTLLFSNSSSIPAAMLHPRCLGAHFFFPVELTGLVELICCDKSGHDHYRHSLHFLQEAGLDVIEQDRRSSFLVNRLLLPLQAASFRALQDGFGPQAIEAASKSELISFGQLSLMDSIGLDIVMAAASNYQALNPISATADINNLISSLELLVNMGKLGAKNRDGLLLGAPLPWPPINKGEKELAALEKKFERLIHCSYQQAIEQRLISTEQLDLVFNRIFHAKTCPTNKPQA